MTSVRINLTIPDDLAETLKTMRGHDYMSLNMSALFVAALRTWVDAQTALRKP